MPPRWRLCDTSSRLLRSDWGNVRFTSPVKRQLHLTSSRRANLVSLRKQLKDGIKQARADGTVPSRSSESEDPRLQKWELTVGIEIHAQLNAIRKLFSRSRPDTGDSPNVNLAPFDVALPGSQPLFQYSSVIPALRAALALGCKIEPVSRFDRKHYFYHDQPSGYQITQYYEPFARDGSVRLTVDDGLPDSDGKELVVGIKQVQMEQDTAKTAEQEDGTSLVDFTRSGQPLIEIISLPQIHSPQAAAAYLRKIQAILLSVDSVTTGMELGGLRADVNVSVRRLDGPAGEHSYSEVRGLGQRTEIKNLSSFKAVEDAIKAERDRQIKLLEAGGQVEGETRGWSQTKPDETRRLRGKEGEVDYRYMPDPDIAPLCIGTDLVEHLKHNLPPVPERLVTLLVTQYGLSHIDAKALVALDNGERLVFFQNVVELLPSNSDKDQLANGKVVGNWVLHEVGALLSSSEKSWSPDLVPATDLARIIELQSKAKITGPSAKQLLKIVFDGNQSTIDQIADRHNLWFESISADTLRELAEQTIESHAEVAAAVRNGNPKKIQFLVGRMMQSGDRSRIDAKQARKVLESILLK